MKYRFRSDLSFEDEGDARLLMDYARKLASKATSINEGEPGEEIGFIDLEVCRHDEGGPCDKLERIEVRKISE